MEGISEGLRFKLLLKAGLALRSGRDGYFYFLSVSKKEGKKSFFKKSEKNKRGGRVERTHHMDFADNYLAVTF